jgi:hypothetical protein
MNVTHKLTKLADGSALKSAGNAFDRWRQPINPEKVLEQIDQAGLEQIRVRYAVPGERTHWPKYLDAPRWTYASSFDRNRCESSILEAEPDIFSWWQNTWAIPASVWTLPSRRCTGKCLSFSVSKE